MVECDMTLRMADGSVTETPNHWRPTLVEFPRWAVQAHPDLVSIRLRMWCDTRESRRTPYEGDFDTRGYDFEIDGDGILYQGPLEMYWVRLRGIWWSVDIGDTMYWYYPDECPPPVARMADWAGEQGRMDPPPHEELRKVFYEGLE